MGPWGKASLSVIDSLGEVGRPDMAAASTDATLGTHRARAAASDSPACFGFHALLHAPAAPERDIRLLYTSVSLDYPEN